MGPFQLKWKVENAEFYVGNGVMKNLSINDYGCTFRIPNFVPSATPFFEAPKNVITHDESEKEYEN